VRHGLLALVVQDRSRTPPGTPGRGLSLAIGDQVGLGVGRWGSEFSTGACSSIPPERPRLASDGASRPLAVPLTLRR
jgi:hypothetical protein